MDKEKIYNDFMNLNFNRINKKQKYKAREYIINSLQGMYDMSTVHGKYYGVKCYNLETQNPDYKILLTAHYDTHDFKSNYIQSFIIRKVQYSSWKLNVLFYFFLLIIFSKLLSSIQTYFNITKFGSLVLSPILLVLILNGFPTFLFTKIKPFNSAPVHDDNNSGIIALLNIAKLLYEKGCSNKVKLLFTDCEEKGMFGSKLFVKNNLTDLKDKIIINFDCVGRGSNIFITSKNNSLLAKELQSFFLSKQINSRLYTKCFSDDKSFQKYNFNSIGIIRGDIGPKGIKLLHWTHTAHDTLDNITLDYMIEIIETITEFIESKVKNLE